MINHNILLDDLLEGTITQSYNGRDFTVNFTEGDLFEFTAALMDERTKYPHIWLQTGYVVGKGQTERETVLKSCRFFFVTKGSVNDRYKKRFRDTYQNILYPLLSKFKKKIEKQIGLSISGDWNFTVLPLNDVDEIQSNQDSKRVGKKQPQTTTTGEIWDAIVLEIDLTISEGCFPDLIIKI